MCIDVTLQAYFRVMMLNLYRVMSVLDKICSYMES